MKRGRSDLKVLVFSVIVLLVVLVIFFFRVRRDWRGFLVSDVEFSVDCENIAVELADAEIRKKEQYIEIELVNRTEGEVNFGEEFALFFWDGRTWKVIPAVSPDGTVPVWIDLLYVINPGAQSTVHFGLTGFDISQEGRYRIIKRIYLNDSEDGGIGEMHNMIMDFQLSRR